MTGFFVSGSRKSGRHAYCRECARVPVEVSSVWRRKRKYGLDKTAHDSLLDAQDGVCGICKQKEWRHRRGRALPLHVDHDHKTSRVRGLLCTDCNLGLGRFKDSPELLTAAIAYLEKYREPATDRPTTRRDSKTRTLPAVRRT